MNNEIIDVVKQVLSEITSNEQVKDMPLETSLKDDLGIDSMTSLTFLMSLEDNIDGFAVDPDTLEASHFDSIKTICEYVEQQLELNSEPA